MFDSEENDKFDLGVKGLRHELLQPSGWHLYKCITYNGDKAMNLIFIYVRPVWYDFLTLLHLLIANH